MADKNLFTIDPDAFEAAFLASKRFAGMGRLIIGFDPYDCEWTSTIDFADKTRWSATNQDVSESLSAVAHKCIHGDRR